MSKIFREGNTSITRDLKIDESAKNNYQLTQPKSSQVFYLSKTQTQTTILQQPNKTNNNSHNPNPRRPSIYQRQNPVESYANICGLGASVGCERKERAFNMPRLKSQILAYDSTGFVSLP